MDCKVTLNRDQSSRYLKVLRARESAPETPVSPGDDKDGNPLPAPAPTPPRTDAEIIQSDLFSHISGGVLYKEKQEAQSSVKEF